MGLFYAGPGVGLDDGNIHVYVTKIVIFKLIIYSFIGWKEFKIAPDKCFQRCK